MRCRRGLIQRMISFCAAESFIFTYSSITVTNSKLQRSNYINLKCNALFYCVTGKVIRKQQRSYSYCVTRYNQLCWIIILIINNNNDHHHHIQYNYLQKIKAVSLNNNNKIKLRSKNDIKRHS